MPERFNLPVSTPAGAATTRRRLLQRIDEALSGTPSPARVVRATVPVEAMDPYRWLRCQPGADRMLWSGRGSTAVTAGVGVADLCAGHAPVDYPSLHGRLGAVLQARHPEVRYFGGIRFDHAVTPSPAWAPFQAYRFVLPRFELHVDGDDATLTCNVYLPRDRADRAALTAAVQRLVLPDDGLDGTLPLPVARRDVPDEAGWHRNIAAALDAFRRGELDKVVLARRATFEFDEAVDPYGLLQQLQRATPNCFHFLFQPAGSGAAFLGASPERLFRRDGTHVRSEAVAGTRPRGVDVAADAQLLQELLLSEKDQREHDYVRRSIRETLAALCTTLHVDETASEMTLANAQHLVSRVHGTLRDDVNEIHLLRGLHPTPAVGGHPKKPGKQAIRRLESFDRGWYAGPVGWIGAEGAEFAVAIRSGLVRGRELALYSGAGIVEGSRPDAEWEEIEHKIGDFVKVLDLDPHPTESR